MNLSGKELQEPGRNSGKLEQARLQDDVECTRKKIQYRPRPMAKHQMGTRTSRTGQGREKGCYSNPEWPIEHHDKLEKLGSLYCRLRTDVVQCSSREKKIIIAMHICTRIEH
jgi:hypothetical protein